MAPTVLTLTDVLIAIAARVTPLERADMKLLIAVYQAAFARGVYCSCGEDGARTGKKLCIPGRWTEMHWTDRGKICRHCPVFRRALEEKR